MTIRNEKKLLIFIKLSTFSLPTAAPFRQPSWILFIIKHSKQKPMFACTALVRLTSLPHSIAARASRIHKPAATASYPYPYMPPLPDTTGDDKMIIYMTRKLTTLQHVMQTQSMASIITHRRYMLLLSVCICLCMFVHLLQCSLCGVCVYARRLLLFFSLRANYKRVWSIFFFSFGWLLSLCGCDAFVLPHQINQKKKTRNYTIAGTWFKSFRPQKSLRCISSHSIRH